MKWTGRNTCTTCTEPRRLPGLWIPSPSRARLAPSSRTRSRCPIWVSDYDNKKYWRYDMIWYILKIMTWSKLYISVFLGRVLGLFTFGTDSAYRLKSVHRVFDTKRKHGFEIMKEIRFDCLDAIMLLFKRSCRSICPSICSVLSSNNVYGHF